MNKMLILVFLCTLIGCKDWGTEGGNPESPAHSSAPAVTSSYLVNSLCTKRQSCTGQTDDTCTQQILLHPLVTTELRMQGSYATLHDLYSAPTEAVSISGPQLKECLTAVRDLDCQSTLGQQAFDAGTYEDVHLALRASTSCGDIFTLKN